jgi:hypothetical protein
MMGLKALAASLGFYWSQDLVFIWVMYYDNPRLMACQFVMWTICSIQTSMALSISMRLAKDVENQISKGSASNARQLVKSSMIQVIALQICFILMLTLILRHQLDKYMPDLFEG